MSMSRSKGRRGKSFSIEEDEALCRAWLAINQDPTIGIGQKNSCCWNRILEQFSATTTGMESRTLCSIQNRWEKIRKDCFKYHGCLSQIDHKHLTRATTSQLDKKILEDGHKRWMEIAADPVPLSSDISYFPSTPISLDSDHDPTQKSVNTPLRAKKRPIRRKAEKESRQKRKLDEEDDAEFISLLKKFNQNSEESILEKKVFAEQKLKILKTVEIREQRKLAILEAAEHREQMKHDSAIMALNTTDMSPELQHYYRMLKNEIIAKVSARLSTSQLHMPSSPDA